MIITQNEYYLYRHIRLDKNEPFYIGIGRKRQNRPIFSWNHEYERAFVKGSSRSKLWNNISFKGYSVEILFETLDYDLILEKEKEFIKLYGRINDKTGTLTNLTDGGEGINNPSLETRNKISFKLKGIIRSDKTKERIKVARKTQISIPRSEESKKRISEKRKGINNPMYNKRGKDNVSSKKVYQYDFKGTLLKEWENARQIDNQLLINYKTISACCVKSKTKRSKGYIFSYTPLSPNSPIFDL